MLLKKIFFYLIGTFILVIPAIYNGYPLVYSDTGSYIFNGMERTVPSDRPVMYGLFINFFSLQFSLWLVVFMQSFIVFFVLWQIFKLATPTSISKRFFLLSMAFFSWFTGLGWYTSQIMPDIFTIITLCVLVLLLFHKNYSWFQKSFFCLILIFSINTHFSNYLIAIATILVLFIITRKQIIPNIKKAISFRLVVFMTVFALAVGSVTNYIIGDSFKITQNSHVFLMGKMLDSGVLKSFLDDNCKTTNYVLCDCKNKLPEDSRILLWDAKSPLQQNGDWKASEESYNDILIGIVSSPKHLSMFLYNAFFSSITQLFQNEVGSGVVIDWYANPASPPHMAISKYFPFELNQYNQSRQNYNLWNQGLDLSYIVFVNFFLLIFAVIILIFRFFDATKRKIYNVQTQIIIFTILIGIVINAIATSSLANVYDRLQARVSWALVFCVLILFMHHKKQFSAWIKSLQPTSK